MERWSLICSINIAQADGDNNGGMDPSSSILAQYQISSRLPSSVSPNLGKLVGVKAKT